MWLFLPQGFFSVVFKYRAYWVRTRVREHLVRLCQRYKLKGEIVSSPDADYRYRLKLTKAQWLKLMQQAAASVTYGNFKAEAHQQCPNDADYNRLLHRVWSETQLHAGRAT